MDINVIETVENPLLQRKEVYFSINIGTTPERIAVKEKLAAMHNADFNLVFVKEIKTRFGTPAVTGYANIYENEEAASIEPMYIRIRNMRKEERDEARKGLKKKKKKKKSQRKK